MPREENREGRGPLVISCEPAGRRDLMAGSDLPRFGHESLGRGLGAR